MTASQFAKSHAGRIRQYHTYWNLQFRAIPLRHLEGLSRYEEHLLHRFPAIGGDLVGSEYYIARVDGSLAWVRVSDHWGPPHRFAPRGGLPQGKYPVTQADYIWTRQATGPLTLYPKLSVDMSKLQEGRADPLCL